MPSLLLFRHAHAEQIAKDGPLDHDRVLSTRGLAEAAATGREMAARGLSADLVLCSTAARTRQTWERAAAEMTGAPPPRFLRAIYDAARDYLDILRSEAGTAQSIVVVGHNPVIQQTAATLSRDANCAPAQNFPTGALAIFDIPGDWADLQPGTARLVEFIRPR